MPYQVKFATGQMVNFSTQPTPKDIEEVASKLNLKPQDQQADPKAGQLFQSIFNKIPKNANNPGAFNLGGIFEAATSGIQGAGANIGAMATENMPGVQDAQNKAQSSANQLGDLQTKLIALQKEKQAAKQDTAALDKVIAENNQTMQSENIGYNANTPEGAKQSDLQMIGNFGEMAMDILASGELQQGAKDFKLLDAAQKARLAEMGVTDAAAATTMAQRLGKVAKFALKNAAIGGGIGYGFDVSKNLQEGKAGMDAATPGWGTLIGTAVPLSFGAYAGIKESVSSASGKTLSEILATPEEDVMKGKLSSSETKTWFDSQSNKIKETFSSSQEATTKKYTEAITARKTAMETQATAAKKELDTLTQQMQGTAIGEVKSTRPAILKAFSNASQTFGDLAQEAVDNAGLSKTSDIGIDNIRTAVANEFSDNPELGNAQLSKLGLSSAEDPLAAMLKDQPGAEVQDMSPTNKLMRQLMGEGEGKSTMTVGEVQQAIKDLRQKMSSAGRRGARTFTAAEMATNRTIAALSDALDKAGVDMGAANKFWREWKPIQQEAMQKFDLFGAKGSSGLESGANALMKKAEGTSLSAQASRDFYSKLEGYLGEPIGTKTKSAFENLTATEQSQVANSRELEDALASLKEEMKTAQDGLKDELSSAQRTLSNKEFEAMRNARFSVIKKRIIKSMIAGSVLYSIPGVKQFINNLITNLY